MAEHEILEAALARIRFFVDAEDREWIVRYPPDIGATLELVPLTVTSMARELLSESADLVVLSTDPFEDLAGCEVVATMTGGRWVHSPPPWE